MTLPKERIRLVFRQHAQTSESSFTREVSKWPIPEMLLPARVSRKLVAAFLAKKEPFSV